MGLIERVKEGAGSPSSITTKEMFPHLGRMCICNGQEWEIIGFLGVQFILKSLQNGNYAKEGCVIYNDDILILEDESIQIH